MDEEGEGLGLGNGSSGMIVGAMGNGPGSGGVGGGSHRGKLIRGRFRLRICSRILISFYPRLPLVSPTLLFVT